jgi:hypothetical protein
VERTPHLQQQLSPQAAVVEEQQFRRDCRLARPSRQLPLRVRGQALSRENHPKQAQQQPAQQ